MLSLSAGLTFPEAAASISTKNKEYRSKLLEEKVGILKVDKTDCYLKY